MGFLDKAKAAAEQAAAKAKEGVDDVQTKRELSQAYNDLGKTAFELAEGGEITHPRLQTTVDKIRTLNAKADGPAADGAPAAAAEPAEPYDPTQPPAMPT
jgi:cob(I)alamin adenosyltransferase